MMMMMMIKHLSFTAEGYNKKRQTTEVDFVWLSNFHSLCVLLLLYLCFISVFFISVSITVSVI